MVTGNYSAPYVEEESMFSYSTPSIVISSFAYAIVMLLAWFSNSLVIATVCRTRSMHSLTNILIANLATADITVSVIVLPITLLSNMFTGQ